MTKHSSLVVADSKGKQKIETPSLPQQRTLGNAKLHFTSILITAFLLSAAALSAVGQTYSGQATAVRLTTTVVGQPVLTTAVADTGDLPNAGGTITLASVGVNLAPVATVGSSTSTTTGSDPGGSGSPPPALSQSTASINNINVGVLSNLITADVVS